MPFNSTFLDTLLPGYLTDADKNRLRSALEQFKSTGTNTDIEERLPFYHAPNRAETLWQGDLVRNIPICYFDIANKLFETDISDGIILTNTCDMDNDSKNRVLEKNVLFAPIINLSDYEADLGNSKIPAERVKIILKDIKSQQYSNIFFLPKNIYDNNNEYIAFLDQISWLPIEYVKKIEQHKDKDRIASLQHLGFYLFIMKLSYHLCRLPEDTHRNI
jgi:hypothetical protein